MGLTPLYRNWWPENGRQKMSIFRPTPENSRQEREKIKIYTVRLRTKIITIRLRTKINTIRLRTKINTIRLRTKINTIRLRTKLNTIGVATKSRLVYAREFQKPIVNHNSHTNQRPETRRTKQSKKRTTNCDHYAAPVSRVRTWPSQWCPQKCGHFLAANFGQQG